MSDMDPFDRNPQWSPQDLDKIAAAGQLAIGQAKPTALDLALNRAMKAQQMEDLRNSFPDIYAAAVNRDRDGWVPPIAAAQGNVNNAQAQGIIDPRWFASQQQKAAAPKAPATKWIYAEGSKHKRAIDAAKLETLYISYKSYGNWAVVGSMGSNDITISTHPTEREAEAALTTLLQSL